ncbi:MAG: hypothetical protein WEC16_01685 [Anaerolineales bacterium]
MDRKGQASLKKALGWIKQGKGGKARPLLVGLLRGEPQNAQAWYLLSYTLDDPQRQQYALLQALRADPEFARARERLEKLRGGEVGELRFDSNETLEEGPPSDTQPLARPVTAEPEPPPPARSEATIPAEPEPFREAELLSAEEPTERARPNIGRLLLPLALVLVIASLGYLVFQALSAPSSVAQRSPTPVSSATLPATFTPTVSSTPSPAPSATVAAQVSPVDPETLAQMQVVQQQVSALRGLQASQEVQNAIIDESMAAAVLADAFIGQAKAEQLEREEAVLKALGLLAESDHLIDYELNRHVDSQGGFYIGSQNGIFLVGGTFSEALPYVYSRMFNQALAYHHHPELSAATGECSILADSCRAVRALLEGETSLLGAQWLEAHASEEVALAIGTSLDQPLLFQGQEPAEFVLLDLAFPGEQGGRFVQTIFDAGGWGQVNSLYADPPLSSEQILSPEKYLAGEKPVAVSDAAFGSVLGSSWESLGSGSLGEWLTYLMLANGVQPEARLPAEAAATSAAGWGGDLFQAYLRTSDGAVALAAHWVMDGVEDAQELTSGLAKYLGLRFAEQASSLSGGLCRLGEGWRTCLFASGAEVLWLLGPDEIVVLQVMLSHYPQFQ